VPKSQGEGPGPWERKKRNEIQEGEIVMEEGQVMLEEKGGKGEGAKERC